jgi:hypothetical protein
VQRQQELSNALAVRCVCDAGLLRAHHKQTRARHPPKTQRARWLATCPVAPQDTHTHLETRTHNAGRRLCLGRAPGLPAAPPRAPAGGAAEAAGRPQRCAGRAAGHGGAPVARRAGHGTVLLQVRGVLSCRRAACVRAWCAVWHLMMHACEDVLGAPLLRASHTPTTHAHTTRAHHTRTLHTHHARAHVAPMARPQGLEHQQPQRAPGAEPAARRAEQAHARAGAGRARCVRACGRAGGAAALCVLAALLGQTPAPCSTPTHPHKDTLTHTHKHMCAREHRHTHTHTHAQVRVSCWAACLRTASATPRGWSACSARPSSWTTHSRRGRCCCPQTHTTQQQRRAATRPQQRQQRRGRQEGARGLAATRMVAPLACTVAACCA